MIDPKELGMKSIGDLLREELRRLGIEKEDKEESE